MSCRIIPDLLLSLLLLTTSITACFGQDAGAKSILTFDDLESVDVTATFETDCAAKEPPDNPQLLQRFPTAKNKFVLYFDPRLTQLAKFGQFFQYTFYVEAHSPNELWYRCATQLSPHGAFLDRNERVHFNISLGNTQDNSSLYLPVHSIAKRDFLEITTNPTPGRVNLSAPDGLELSLRNLLPDMAILVEPKAQVTSANPTLWESGETVPLSENKEIRIEAGDTAKVRLMVKPRRLQALLSTLASVKPEAVHDRLAVSLNYTSDFGGANRVKPADVNVRFAPSFINLFIALLSGSLLGTAAAQLLPGIWKGWISAAQSAGRGLLFSFIAELFAMLMVALGSSLVILQFDLDPWQFLPVLFIGFIVSGGKEVLAYIGLTRTTAANPEPDPSLKGRL